MMEREGSLVSLVWPAPLFASRLVVNGREKMPHQTLLRDGGRESLPPSQSAIIGFFFFSPSFLPHSSPFPHDLTKREREIS